MEHEDLIQEIMNEHHDILTSSLQGVYIYLDDDHKVCNEKFASLLGYKSAKEWANTKGNFPEIFVDEKSQRTLVTTYQKAIQEFVGSTINIRWKKKSGGTVDTNVILVPIGHKEHTFALHFVS